MQPSSASVDKLELEEPLAVGHNIRWHKLMVPNSDH